MAEGDVPAGEQPPPRCLLPEWRQGDCVIGPQRFYYRAAEVGTAAAGEPPQDGNGDDVWKEEVEGLVVITQNCDIERDVSVYPRVEVAALVKRDGKFVKEGARQRRPRFALVPQVATMGLVADLSRVMVVEKEVVAAWPRHPGCVTDDDRRAFARALARKYERFAFPTDFTTLVGELTDMLKETHDRPSPEGRALRALQWIRVRADPGWDEEQVSLEFLFVRSEVDATFEGRTWEELAKKWMALVPTTGRFKNITWEVADMDRFTMRDFVATDPLDLDRLSGAARPAD